MLKIETDSFEVVETIEFVDVSELEGGLEFSEAAKLLKVLEVVMPLDIADSLPIDWLELSIILLDPVMVAEGLVAADNKPESVAELLLKISIEDGSDGAQEAVVVKELGWDVEMASEVPDV